MRKSIFSVIVLVMSSGLFAQLTVPGGHQVLTQDRRLRIARKTGDYLVSVLRNDGTFAYEISLKSGEPTERYVWGDHAMTVLTLARLYEHTQERAYLDAAIKATKPLVDKLAKVTVEKKGYTTFVGTTVLDGEERKVVRTSDCALVAAALTTVDRVGKTTQYAASVKELCNYLKVTITSQGTVKPVLILGATDERNAFVDVRSQTVHSKVLFSLATVNESAPSDIVEAALHRLINQCAYKWQQAVENPHSKPFDHWGLIGVSRFLKSVDDTVMKKLSDDYLKYVDDTCKSIEAKLKTDLSHQRRKVLGKALIEFTALRQVVKGAGPISKAALRKLIFSYCQNELLALIRQPRSPNRGSFDTRLRTAGRLLPTLQRIEGVSAIATLILQTPDSPRKKLVGSWVFDVDLARRFVLSRQISLALSKQYNAATSVAGAYAVNSVCIMPCFHAINAFLGW